jgi:RHS repeat-associated protein
VTDDSGNETFHYLYGLNIDQVLAQDSPTGMVWSLADRLGTVDLLTDAVGNVANTRTYDSFGKLLNESDPTVSFRYGYTGREEDKESGLDYYRARYYDPNVGRFISVDPIGFEAGDTNLYRYVGNNSTNATDPSGEWANFVAGAAIGAVLDVGMQLWENRGTDKGIDLNRLAISTLTGAIGGGIGGFLSKQGVGLAARTAITAGAEFNLGYWGKVAENKFTGKDDLFDGALLSGSIGGIAGAGGELVTAGVGAGWKKYGSSITAGAKNLDQWGGKTFQQVGRAIDNGLDLFSGSKLQPAFAAVGNGLDGSLNITRTAFNDGEYLKSYIHPLFKNRINVFKNDGLAKGLKEENLLLGMGIPGTHAEVIAASRVLRRIEKLNPGLKITEENAQEYLSKMMSQNMKTMNLGKGDKILQKNLQH